MDQPPLVMGDVMPDDLTTNSTEPDQSEPDLVAALQAAEAPASEPDGPPVEPLQSPPVEAPAEPPPPEPPAGEPTATAPDPAEPGAGDDEATKLTRFIDDGWGTKLKDKYENDAATITGLVELTRAMGRRDADAEYGRAVRQHEGAFQQFLQQQQGQGQPQQQQPQQQPVQPQQPAAPEWEQVRHWQDIVAREGESAPADVRRNLEQVQQRIQRGAFEWAYNRDKLIADAVKQPATEVATQASQQVTQQQQAAQQEQQQLATFNQTNQSWMYRDVNQPHDQNNLTDEGRLLLQTAGAVQHQAKQTGRPVASSQALEWARLMLVDQQVKQQQQQQAQVQPVQPVKPAAQHQPAVAAPAGGNPEEEYRQDIANIGTDKSIGLGGLLAKWTDQREAVANQTG